MRGSMPEFDAATPSFSLSVPWLGELRGHDAGLECEVGGKEDWEVRHKNRWFVGSSRWLYYVGCGVVFRESRSSKTCLLLPIKQGGCWGTSGRVAGQAGRVAACGRGVENTCFSSTCC
ncbi:hypothetical protein B0H13DRAFT_1882139 [Mycena leptocephala]|nr:hypothetical protein B0H13DRAFT_1882139 [Mycena leptocephala]